MTRLATKRRPTFSIGILVAAFALALGLAPQPQAQTQPAPSYKFNLTDGPRKTNMKIWMKDSLITSVTGTRDRRNYNFKPVKAGEKPKLTGRPNQALKCGVLKHDGGDFQWTLCFYVDNSDGSAADKPGGDFIEILSFSWGSDFDGGGGGGGGGGDSNCWEDQDLQMSICDP